MEALRLRGFLHPQLDAQAGTGQHLHQCVEAEELDPALQQLIQAGFPAKILRRIRKDQETGEA